MCTCRRMVKSSYFFVEISSWRSCLCANKYSWPWWIYLYTYMLMRLQTSYPKISHLGVLNTFSWRTLRKWQEQEPSITLLPWNRPRNTHVRGTFPKPRGKEHPYLWQQWDAEKNPNRPCCFPQFTANTSYSLTYQIPPLLYTSPNLA